MLDTDANLMDPAAGADPNDVSGARPEAQLLFALARLRLANDLKKQIFDFLTINGKNLDWGYFLDQAGRHGVLPLVGKNLIQLRLAQSDVGRSLAPYRWIYSYVYEGNRRRNLALGDEYAKLLRGLNDAGLKHAIRKGPVMCEGVYHDIGVRRMGDLDVLLRREDFPDFEKVVSGLGYVQGQQSRSGEEVIPFDRKTRMFWQVNLTNVSLPYVKLAHRDDVEMFIIDPCFSLFQKSSGITADSESFLERAVDTVIYGEPSRMLDPADQIIDACVQLHVEATTLYYIEIGKDLTLLKFIDLVEILRRTPVDVLNSLPERVRSYGCEDSVFYALHYAARLYPEDVPAKLIAQFEPGDQDFLHQFGGFDGDSQTWELPFVERLFNHRRSQSVTAGSTVPGPRAAV
ncbi:nucleotidyltransferase family protein [Streptomyces sp. SPB162]|uniref:nucleotidyltransferase family protein n=1 Tax=Streptomyces sp. SPB162 TaxID=2940560 RepID=UPI002404BD48|nr:nucleotidyltransferase family protein [Streptomyces sp. SPB162]MDF9811451.1 hypothetical protein [Streptomyces sp. SPB162]